MSHQARLRQWAARMLPEPKEGGEEGRVKRIRCQTETQVWDTWDAPFAAAETWCEEVEALIDAQADQLPIRRHTITFTAEDEAGAVVAQCTTAMQGKNKDANEFGAQNAAAKAITEAVEGISRTVNTVLRSAATQVESLTKSCESQATQIHDLIELVKSKQEKEIVEAETAGAMNAEITQMILAQVGQFGGPLLELGKMWLERQPSSVVSAMRTAAEVATATNGKAPH